MRKGLRSRQHARGDSRPVIPASCSPSSQPCPRPVAVRRAPDTAARGRPLVIRSKPTSSTGRVRLSEGQISLYTLVLRSIGRFGSISSTYDVTHSWWVPGLTGRRTPSTGRPRPQLHPVREGTYEAMCAEFCGILHAVMPTTVEWSPRRSTRIASRSSAAGTNRARPTSPRPRVVGARVRQVHGPRVRWTSAAHRQERHPRRRGITDGTADRGQTTRTSRTTCRRSPRLARVPGAGAHRVHPSNERLAQPETARHRDRAEGDGDGRPHRDVSPTWREGRGTSWLTTVDHNKRIGISTSSRRSASSRSTG